MSPVSDLLTVLPVNRVCAVPTDISYLETPCSVNGVRVMSTEVVLNSNWAFAKFEKMQMEVW